MIKVYQNIIDKGNGDCMQAVIASLFEKKMEEVPMFISFGKNWFSEFYKFVNDNGHSYDGTLNNKIYSKILSPNRSCFEIKKDHKSSIISKYNLSKELGINGLFFASVLSPKYTESILVKHTTHAVIIDKDFNIIHDPNPEYKNIIQYPLADIIGYKGIIDIYLINPK